MNLRFACLAALIGLCPEYGLLGESPIPMAEEYLSGGRIPAYNEDARAYLKQNPRARLSPRLAHDLYMVATITGNEQVADQEERILDNPYLATSAGLGTLLRYTLTPKGAWIPPASSAKGITKHILRLAYSDDPKEKFISIGVSSDGKLRTIGFGKWNLHSIRYGSNSLLANSPPWPDMPIDEHKEFDFASFMGLIASFMDSSTK
jgi:hypothetical protein